MYGGGWKPIKYFNDIKGDFFQEKDWDEQYTQHCCGQVTMSPYGLIHGSGGGSEKEATAELSLGRKGSFADLANDLVLDWL